MKTSTFNQTWETTGAIKTVKGEIVVTMNYISKTITGHNPSTHDDVTKNIPVHKIEGWIDGVIYYQDMNAESEHGVILSVDHCKKQMEATMYQRANSQPVKTFLDKMSDLGFK